MPTRCEHDSHRQYREAVDALRLPEIVEKLGPTVNPVDIIRRAEDAHEILGQRLETYKAAVRAVDAHLIDCPSMAAVLA